jgi:HAE1 family hydrophobic/amphiphilic exporter-1
MNITEIAVKRPLLIVVFFTVLFLFGIQSYLKLNYNLLPAIEINMVTVTTVYPGASAAEVETSVTKNLEDGFSSIEGLDQINSSSQEGVSQISVQLKASADIDQAERDIQRKADQLQGDLPDAVQKPIVTKINLQDAPVIQAGVISKLDSRDLYQIIDKQIRPALQNVGGVGQVNIIGGDEREIQVNIDQTKLKAYGLNINQVTQAISNGNLSFPAGSIETKNQQFSIQYDANVVSVQQLQSLIIQQNPRGGSVYLHDIAEIIDANAKTTAINHINGLPSIGIEVVKQTDANAVDVSKLVKAAFSGLEQQYKSNGMKFIISNDQSTYTLSSANNVMKDLGLTILIVGFVMLVFLHSFRNAMFVMVALPSSIIPTFIAMYFFGFSLNLMTLMAMSLVVGILVDDSIVVLENIYRYMESGSGRVRAALVGRSEIGFTAIAITLVDVVVFLPLSFAGGIIGGILKEFSLVVVFSTLMSLLVSFTITPLLASRFGKLPNMDRYTVWGAINQGFEDFIERLKNSYAKILNRVLRKKRWLLSGVFVLFIGSFMLLGAGFIGSTFIPSSDQGQLIINLELEPSASIYQTNMATQAAERIIMARPEVTNVFSSIGIVGGSVAGSSNNSNLAAITVSLVKDDKRTVSSTDFGLMIQQKLSSVLPGVKVTAAASSITSINQPPVQIAVKGNDINQVRKTAEQLKGMVSAVPGTEFVELSVKNQKPQVEINLDRKKMAIFGLNADQVGATLQNAFSGNDKSKFKQKGNEYAIQIGLDSYDKTNIDDVKGMSFTNTNGESFVLSQFAEVTEGMGESVLQRSSRLNSITINAYVAGRPVGTVAADIKTKFNQVTLPAGISVEFLGDAKNQADAFGSLGIALLTAFVLVYLIMVALYESAIYPFVVLFSIPVALIGALLALALSMETLSVFSIIGMIMLLGLVAKNAILIVDFTNHLKSEGKSARRALIEAGKERLRPILMTTLAMIMGMLPIALASGSGSEVKKGMAWVIIGGLTSSMMLTLFVVPAIYLIVEELSWKRKKCKKKHIKSLSTI